MTLLAGGMLSACGSSTSGGSAKIDSAAVERAIANSILTQKHIETHVVCPSGIAQRKGRRFTCQARLDVGSYPVSVAEVDGHGHVRYGNPNPIVVLKIANVSSSITRSILAQRKLHARVDCPSEVLQQKGLKFTCTAAIAGRSYPFAVTEADGQGHVRYVGR